MQARLRAEQLSREHLSVRRNPLIAEAFHRTGAIEAWGRGTNRVIEACRARSLGFDPVVQWLANRGYAVLQVNYRGSTGYGKAFVNAGDRAWAGAMRTDLADARDWSIARGYARRVRLRGGHRRTVEPRHVPRRAPRRSRRARSTR